MSDTPIILLIIGATGQVGRSLVQLAAKDANFCVIAPARDETDLANADAVRQALIKYQPHYVINAAAYTDVEGAEGDEHACYALNADAVGMLGRACDAQQIPLIHLSTDYVFDGLQSLPYTEDDATAPLSVYGASKLAGEEQLRKATPRHILLRVCGVFSPWRKNFVKTIFNAFVQEKTLRVIADQYCCPTGAADIARVILAIIQQLQCGANAWGTYHYVAADITSWHNFAENIVHEAAHVLGRKPIAVAPITTAEYPTRAKRPANSVLNCEKIRNTFGIQQRSWQADLSDVIAVLAREQS